VLHIFSIYFHTFLHDACPLIDNFCLLFTWVTLLKQPIPPFLSYEVFFPNIYTHTNGWISIFGHQETKERGPTHKSVHSFHITFHSFFVSLLHSNYILTATQFPFHFHGINSSIASVRTKIGTNTQRFYEENKMKKCKWKMCSNEHTGFRNVSAKLGRYPLIVFIAFSSLFKNTKLNDLVMSKDSVMSRD